MSPKHSGRANLVTLLAMGSLVLASCGGGGGGGGGGTSSAPASTEAVPATGAAPSAPPVAGPGAAPGPSTNAPSTARWSATQTLSQDGIFIRPPTIAADGLPWMSWAQGRSSVSVLNQSHASGSGWQTRSQLAGLAASAFSSTTSAVASGTSATVAWDTFDSVTGVTSLWAQTAGTGATPAQKVSEFNVSMNSYKLVTSPDGGLTVIWFESYVPNLVTGRLVSRHWSPSVGWGAIKEIETSKTVQNVRAQAMPDGRAMLSYEMEVPASPRTTYNTWARTIDAVGNASAATLLSSDGTMGFSTGWGTQFVVSGNDVVAAWTQEFQAGGYCVVSRVYRAQTGAWTAPVCVNPSERTGSQPLLKAGSSGHVLLSWMGQNTLYGVTLDATTRQWSAPRVIGAVPASNEALDSRLFDVALCADGAAALLWTSRTTQETLVSMAVSTPEGVWRPRQELGRWADAAPDVVRLGVDAQCNWTALWNTHATTGDRIIARRLLADQTLQPAVVLASDVTLPAVSLSGYRYFTGTLALAVEAAGAVTVAWDESNNTARPLRWQRFE